SRSDRSAPIPTARPPASVISSAIRRASSGARSTAATRAPSCANSRAVAAPIPLAAPVTTATRPAMERRSPGWPDMGPDPSDPDRNGAVDLGSIAWAVVVASVFAVPLALSMWGLLDAARRPQWAWALAGRSQVGWMAAILLGIFTVVGGI